FGKNLSFTIGIMFAVQAAINTGMSIGVLPAKGMPLPFISYGGSSMLYSLITIGILFNISRKKQR
ncbi:MAG: FtsW/RodA/SpoVE family cell cycle protein, partial [Endomicrobiaceae bacterium]|nr:FtsW/RodA/SpoVE family cell cycle protein [Endomicrobiaceae bacterium]